MSTTGWSASHFQTPAELGCDTPFFDSDADAHLLLLFCKFCGKIVELVAVCKLKNLTSLPFSIIPSKRAKRV